jgi:arylsulfatase A-like enzyme
MKISLLTLSAVLLCPLCGFAAEPAVKLPAKEKFHLYLLIGQSNMAGRGAVEEQDKVPHPRVLMFTKERAWAPALDPLHFDKPIAGVGLGSAFGRAMAEADSEATIGLIPCAVGGTPLSRWEKGKDLYKQAVERAQAAQADGTLKGILWHQGEGDSGQEETAKTYGERLGGMIGALRTELGAGDVPFVAGQLGEFLAKTTREGKPSFWPLVNEQIDALPSRVKNVGVASSAGLKHKGDGVHFDSAGLREFGRRYAAVLQTLRGDKPKAGAASDPSPSCAKGAINKPNILLIVADDLGWADVGWHGSQFKTPTLDRLVREGIELDRHYVQPVCSPTRTALLSGRWTGRWGPHVLQPTNRRAFPPGTTTLATALKQVGYTTAIAGKCHLGSKPEWGPNEYGFDHSYGSLTGAVDPWTHQYRKGPLQHTWHRDGKFLHEEGNATELVAAEAAGWIRKLPEPWLVYVPFHAVHIPIDAPDQYKRAWADAQLDPDPARNESLRRMAAFVGQLDAKVGDFVAALDETGRRERTLIVFTSDNGGKTKGDNPYVGSVPPTPALSSNLPLRGEKAGLYEGGVRVSAFAHWQGTLTPRKVTAPMHAADWMPTLTRLAGWQPTKSTQFDGQDVRPLLTGEIATPEPRTIYIPLPKAWAVLRGGWKLIVRDEGPKGLDDGDPAELFNVSADPSESQELAVREPARAAELRRILADLRRGDLDELPADLVGAPN